MAGRAAWIRGGLATRSTGAGRSVPSSTSVCSVTMPGSSASPWIASGIAIGGQLEGVEPEDLRPPRVVTGLAVGRGRDAVTAAAANVGHRRDAFVRRAHGVRAVLVPLITGKHPSLRSGLPQEPRLDLAALEREFLPEPRADGKIPSTGVGDVDGASWRQKHPSSLAGAVAPERVLRRERARPVEPGLRQPLRCAQIARLERRRHRAPRHFLHANDSERHDDGGDGPGPACHRSASSGGSIGAGTRLRTGGSDCR